MPVSEKNAPIGRILIASSEPRPWYDEIQDCTEHFKRQRYTLGAIMYNMEKMGWQIRWAGMKTTKSFHRLRDRIDAFQPDIVYTYGASTALHPLICRKHYCQWKNFLVVHGWDDAYGDIWGGRWGLFGRIPMDILEKLIVTRSDKVVTLSYYLQNRGRKWGVESKYIPNGADPIAPEEIKGDFHLEGDMNIVYTGDKAKWKRTEDICEAMRHVPKNIKLYLTGGHYTYLDKYASDNCIFLGWLTKEEQYKVMSQADVFVCTANQDCNAKLQEYLRWKKPILGYDDRANLFFKNGENALLTKNYPEAIMRLYNDPTLRQRLAENAEKQIPLFSWREIAEQFDAYFRKILAEVRK